MSGIGTWGEHARGILDTCERLQRGLAALEQSTESSLRDLRHTVNNNKQRIETHIEICNRRERATDLDASNLRQVLVDITRHREEDLAEAKRIRAEDMVAINATLATINKTIGEKTGTTTKLLWAALVAWAGTATGGMVWALGKLLHLL